MISPWLVYLLTIGIVVVLGIGLYLLAWHRGYVAGRADHIGGLPGDAWKRPPSENEFMAELLDQERKKPEPPRKYHREP